MANKVAPEEKDRPVSPNLHKYTEFHRQSEVDKMDHAHDEVADEDDELFDPRIPTFIARGGKKYYFAPVAFGCLTMKHPIRKFAIHVITNKWFERTILLFIVLNSIILAMTDYSVIDNEYSPVDEWEGETSYRNSLSTSTESIFIVAFTFEMLFKILGMGFLYESFPADFNSAGRPDTYLRDYWNMLDFVVVIAGFATFVPNVPNVSVMRTFRVLRPLKSVAGLEGVKMVLSAVTNAIPELMSVIVLLFFVFSLFGILGLQFFSGVTHSRCRLTPYPVTQNWVSGMDWSEHACILGDTHRETMKLRFNKIESNPTWSKESSIWSVKQPCYWPIDPDDSRLCGFKGSGGAHTCAHGSYFSKYVLTYNPDKAETWCGSNYDARGNGRFQKPKPGSLLDIYGQDHQGQGREYSSSSLLQRSANFNGDHLWGLIDFDDFLRGFLSIFQTITLEGWTDIMYMHMDVYQPGLTAFFFIVLVLFGSFFVLNLLLAVLETKYNEQEEAVFNASEKKRIKAENAAWELQIGALTFEAPVDLNGKPRSFATMTDKEIGAQIDYAAGWTSEYPMSDTTDFEDLMEGSDLDRKPALNVWGSLVWAFGWCFLDPASEEAQVRPQYRQFLYDLVSHPHFNIGITVCIVFNTVALAADHWPMDEGFEDNLEVFNFIFTVIFIVEMLLKLPGLGVRDYFSDNFNLFDFIIVVISIFETISIPPSFIKESDSTGGGGISALRSFRLFRIFKLAREWEAMRQLLDLIVKTAIQMSNFMLLFVLFIYIFALLGMQFFGGRMHFDPEGYPVAITDGEDRGPWLAAEIPRGNFDSLTWASVTIFAILSGENWNANMYDGIRAAEHPGIGIAYFVALVVLGGMIVMNIFMAILLANFDELGQHKNEDEAEKDEVKDALEGFDEEEGDDERRIGSGSAAVAPDPGFELGTGVKSKKRLSSSSNPGDQEKPGQGIGRNGPATQLGRMLGLSGRESVTQPKLNVFEHPESFKARSGEESISVDAQALPPLLPPPDEQHALGKAHTLFFTCRLLCRKVVTRKWFDNGILVCIILSSVTLAIDSPLSDPTTSLSVALLVLDWIMTVIFSVEMCLKMVGLGLWGHSEAYLTNGWNLLDGIIVVVGWIGLTADSSLSAFKALRALRALKPLRMINRYPGLQVVVGTMISSLGAILNVAIVTILVFIIFSIMAVNYLKGKFYSCQGDGFDAISGTAMGDFLTTPDKWSELTPAEQGWFQFGSQVPGVSFEDAADGGLGCSADGTFGCCAGIEADFKPTSKQVCECWGLDWDRMLYQRFDNTWVALGALFEISTTEGWVDVMLAAVDSTDIHMQPIENNQEFWIVFFIIFMIIGSYLMTNLFVGVIIQNFNELKAEKENETQQTGQDEGDLFITEEQKSWQMTQKLLASMLEMQFYRIAPPKNWFRATLFHVVNHPSFEQIIMGCIIANTCAMAVAYFGMNDDFAFILDVANFLFAQIFNLECVFKLIALGSGYFYHLVGARVLLNNWNVFDFVVVLGTNVGMVVSPPFQKGGGGGGGGVATVIRMFRIGRLLRLINGAKDIKKMFDTLIVTLPGLANVAAVVFLLFFIFAVIGMQLFATVAFHESLDPHANFRTFSQALITLLRFSTGENWNGFMYEAAHGPYSGWSDTESFLESDASNERIPNSAQDSGSGYCDPSPEFKDEFVGGPYDGLMYGDVMCGFVSYASVHATQAEGCVELNGCANFVIFPYLKAFTLLITFVFLNLFVGIILDGFDQAEEQGGAATISEPAFIKIWEHWVTQYDPEETYYIDIHKIKSFLQTLEEPWGFGLQYVASDAELIYRVKDLNLTVGPDGKIHFFKVLKGLSRRHIALTKGKLMVQEIDMFEKGTPQPAVLTKYFPNFNSIADGAGGERSGSNADDELEDLSHILARMVIRKALKHYLNWKRFSGQVRARTRSRRESLAAAAAAAEKRSGEGGGKGISLKPSTGIGSSVGLEATL